MRSRTFFLIFGLIFTIIVILAGYIIIQELRTQFISPIQNLPAQTVIPTRTQVEREILQDPSKVNVEKLLSLAENTSILHILDCTPSPFVMRMKQGKKYVIRNNSLIDHTLSFNGEKTVTVKALSDKTMKADFGETGVFGYGCDTSAKAVGFVVISE